MSNITNFPRPTGAPPPLTGAERRQIDRALSALEPDGPHLDSISATVLTDELRAFLVARRETLMAAFQRANPDEVEIIVGRFLGSYTASDRFDEDKYDRYIENAHEAIWRVPAWVLKAVVSRFRRAVAGNPSYVPTVPELSAEATKELAPWIKEATEIERLLRAKVFRERTRSLEECARIDAAVATLKAAVDGSEGGDEARKKKRAAESADALAWAMAGLMKARGLTSMTLDERLDAVREYQPDFTGTKRWDSRKGPAGTGRPRGARPVARPSETVETPGEAFARLSGLAVSDVIAKLNAMPNKASMSNPPRSAAHPTTDTPPHERLPTARGGPLD